MRIIAHRGGAGLRVENTLAAFEHAIALGADGAELDVHLSHDGEVVVHHDDTLNPAYCRHAGGNWITPAEARSLASMNYAEMHAYDIGAPRPGSAYARTFAQLQPTPGQHIPLLRDVLRLARERSERFILVVEIKAAPLDAAAKSWRPLVDATLAAVAAERFESRTILCSFDWGALRYAQHCKPGLPTWFTSMPLSWFGDARPLASDIPPDAVELEALRVAHATGSAPWCAGFDPRAFDGSHPRAVAAAAGNAWFPWHRDFTAATASELAAEGLHSAVWTYNLRDPAEVTRLRSAGVDSLVTDYPAAPMPGMATP